MFLVPAPPADGGDGPRNEDDAAGSDERAEEEEDISNPLELFFDVVFVFAFTQVTTYLSNHLHWMGMVRGLALVAVLWWGWVAYSWLTDSIPTGEVLSQRVAVLTATVVMFAVALAVPNAFGSAGLLFGVAYFVVRLLHVALYVNAVDSDERNSLLVPGLLGGPALLVAAGPLDGPAESALWVAGIAFDYGVVWFRGVGELDINPSHFVERYRDIVIIALGESVLAMGAGVSHGGLSLSPGVVAAALLGLALTAALAGVYFDWVTIAAERRLTRADESKRPALARDSYSYVHLLLIAGVIFVALGLERSVVRVWEPLALIGAAALCGGGALYMLGHVAFELRDVGDVNVPRLTTAVACVAFLPVSTRLPAVATVLGLVVLFVALVGYEVEYSDFRQRIRTSDP